MDGQAANRPERRRILTGYAVILAWGALMLYCASSGFGWGDESNYLAMADRLFRGDRLIVHEWHPTQWFAVFTLPLYALYHGITGSADGSLLYMRVLYALFSIGVSLKVFRSFYPFKGVGPALIGALVNQVFTRGFPGTFSYDTIPTLCLVLATSQLYAYANGRERRRTAIAAGAAFAVAAGSYPYLGVLYFAAAAAALALWKRVAPRWRRFIGLSALGIAVVALPYVAFALRGGDFGRILEGMRFIFSDPEHLDRSLIDIARAYVSRVYRFYGLPLIVPSAALVAYAFVKRVARKKMGTAEGLMLLAAGAAVCCAQMVLKHGERCVPLYSLALLGFQAFLQTEKPDRAMFYGVFLPGFLFSLSQHYASNTGFRAVSAGLAASGVASVCLIWNCAAGLAPLGARRVDLSARAAAALALAAGMAVLGLPYVRHIAGAVSGNSPVALRQGPAAGLRVTEAEAEQYQAVYDVIQEYASGEGNLIVTRLAPWAYMASSMRCGAPTTWRLRFNEERLAAYLRLFPDRRPDLILSLKPEYDPRGYMWNLQEENVGPENVNRALLDYAEENGMERIDTKAAVLFRRR